MKSLFLLLFLYISSASGRPKLEYSESSGPISIGVGVGYAGFRILNSDGSWAAYNGVTYSTALEIKLFRSPMGSSSFSVFGDYTFAKADEAKTSSSKLEHSSTSFGARFYPFDFIFVGLGYGQGNEKISDTAKINLKHSFTKMSLGFEFGLEDSLSLGLQAHYRVGPITRKENSSLNFNSSFESTEGFIYLNWSPKVLNITSQRR